MTNVEEMSLTSWQAPGRIYDGTYLDGGLVPPPCHFIQCGTYLLNGHETVKREMKHLRRKRWILLSFANDCFEL